MNQKELNSLNWDKRRREIIAQGALTNSKRPESFVKGVYPTTITKTDGAFSYDISGNRYRDFICSLGVNLIGFNNRRILDAVTKQLEKGNVFSLGSDVEVEFGEKIKSIFPYMEKIKVLKSGSEGCSAAIRIAIAYQQSKRKIVVVR